MRRKNCVLVPAAGRKTQLFNLIFTEHGKRTLAHPCMTVHWSLYGLLQPPILLDIEILLKKTARKNIDHPSWHVGWKLRAWQTGCGWTRANPTSQFCSLSMHFALLWKTPWNRLQDQCSYPRQGIVKCISLNLWQRVVNIRVHIGLLPRKSLHFHFSRAYFPLSFNATACYVMFLRGSWGEGWMQHMSAGAHSVSWIWDGGSRQEVGWTEFGLFIPVALKPTVHEMEDIMWYSWKGTFCADSVFSRACIDIVEMQWPYALGQYCSRLVVFHVLRQNRIEQFQTRRMSIQWLSILSLFLKFWKRPRAHDIRYNGCACVVFLHHFAYIICVFLPDQHETRFFSSPSHVLDPFNIWKLESIVEY